MANVVAPGGFQFSRLYNSAAPNYAVRTAVIPYNYASKIASGDPVYLTSTGTIALYAHAGTTIHGIFRGCEYLGAYGSYFRSNSWQAPAGLASTTVVTAYVDIDPMSVFQVQVNGGPATQANIGDNADILVSTSGAPSAAGISTCLLDGASFAVTATLPFRIVGIVPSPAINFLYDPTQTNNWVEVMMNTSDITTRTGQA